MNNLWKKTLLPFVFVATGFAGMKAIEAVGNDQADADPIDTRPTVEVESLSLQDYQVVLTSFGEVAALERTQLSAQVSGEVVRWHRNFVAGGLVKRGEVLVSIEKDSYEAALFQAQAELSQAQASLIEERARAKVAQEEAKRAPKAKVSDLYLRKPQVLSAEAAVASAQARLKIAERDLANCDVLAPYNALVISRDIGLGQFITQGAQVGELNNIEYAEITFPVAGFDTMFLPDKLQGQPATIVGRGLNKVQRDGQIVRDLGIVDSATRMAQLVVRIADPYSLNSEQARLKFGTYAEINFIGKTLENVFRLPQELVTNQTVWVVDQQLKLEPRTVAVLREEGDFFLIHAGLNEDDRLVTTLPEYPRRGMQVKLASSTSISTSTDPDS